MQLTQQRHWLLLRIKIFEEIGNSDGLLDTDTFECPRISAELINILK